MTWHHCWTSLDHKWKDFWIPNSIGIYSIDTYFYPYTSPIPSWLVFLVVLELGKFSRLFLQNCLGYSGFFAFPYKSSIRLLIGKKKAYCDLEYWIFKSMYIKGLSIIQVVYIYLTNSFYFSGCRTCASFVKFIPKHSFFLMLLQMNCFLNSIFELFKSYIF